MNIFLNKSIAESYDGYYQTESGKAIDKIEKEAIKNLLKNLPRLPMLELGCGTGQWTEFFFNLGFPVTAIDSSEEMLNIAKSKHLQNVSFQKANVLDLPFPDNSFSIISTITMLEFTGNIKKAFQEIYRVLKPNGCFIAGCLNAKSELGKVKDDDEILKYAEFFTEDSLRNHLLIFGEPEISQCVYFSPEFELFDGKLEQHSDEGAFFAACVKKIK